MAQSSTYAGGSSTVYISNQHCVRAQTLSAASAAAYATPPSSASEPSELELYDHMYRAHDCTAIEQ